MHIPLSPTAAGGCLPRTLITTSSLGGRSEQCISTATPCNPKKNNKNNNNNKKNEFGYSPKSAVHLGSTNGYLLPLPHPFGIPLLLSNHVAGSDGLSGGMTQTFIHRSESLVNHTLLRPRFAACLQSLLPEVNGIPGSPWVLYTFLCVLLSKSLFLPIRINYSHQYGDFSSHLLSYGHKESMGLQAAARI